MATDSHGAHGAVSRIDSSADTISSFIADWVQIKHFYFEAASLAQELCETLLASNAIRAIVTHRVKLGPRLEAKLKERVRKLGREYRSAKEIRDDVVDLAGVRIALYFPSDRGKVDKIINDAFADVKQKIYPDPESKRKLDSVVVANDTSLEFEQRFHGYSADHYRVRMKVDNLATKKQRDDFQKTNPVIEIQVASVLMHAWAEIDHDLVYKTLSNGPASQQELRLLDATNGLVHTGEVLLQQLQTAMDDRVASQNKPFSEQYELLSFLRARIKRAKGTMEHLDILLLVLKITGLDSPRRLGDILEGFLIPPTSTDPIALVILEHILESIGEEQRRSNNLYLRARTVIVDDLQLDKTNKKYYLADVPTRDRFLDQRDILEVAVAVVDIMRFPDKSILVVDGMPQKFKKFYDMHTLVHAVAIRPDKRARKGEKWLCDVALKELDPLWTWFETNDDVLFRVSLLLARMNVEEIDQELIKLRPSSDFQRLPSAHDASPGYVSSADPRDTSSGHPSPGYFSTSSLVRNDPHIHTERNATPTGTVKGKGKVKTLVTPKTQSRQEARRVLTPVPIPIIEEATDSGTEEEESSDEDASPIIMPERKRQPYQAITKPQPERKAMPKVNKSRPKPERKVSERQVYTSASTPPSRKSTQHAYVEDGDSEDTDLEPRRPLVELYEDEPRQRYRSRSPARPRKRDSARGQTPMPGNFPIPEVPDVPPGYPPPPLDIDPHENARREYDERLLIEENTMPPVPPIIEPSKPRRRESGRESARPRKNEYYMSNEPALRARFGPSNRNGEAPSRGPSHEAVSPHPEAQGLYQYPGLHGIPPHEQPGAYQQYAGHPGHPGTPQSEPGNYQFPGHPPAPQSEPGNFGYGGGGGGHPGMAGMGMAGQFGGYGAPMYGQGPRPGGTPSNWSAY